MHPNTNVDLAYGVALDRITLLTVEGHLIARRVVVPPALVGRVTRHAHLVEENIQLARIRRHLVEREAAPHDAAGNGAEGLLQARSVVGLVVVERGLCGIDVGNAPRIREGIQSADIHARAKADHEGVDAFLSHLRDDLDRERVALIAHAQGLRAVRHQDHVALLGRVEERLFLTGLLDRRVDVGDARAVRIVGARKLERARQQRLDRRLVTVRNAELRRRLLATGRHGVGKQAESPADLARETAEHLVHRCHGDLPLGLTAATCGLHRARAIHRDEHVGNGGFDVERRRATIAPRSTGLGLRFAALPPATIGIGLANAGRKAVATGAAGGLAPAVGIRAASDGDAPAAAHPATRAAVCMLARSCLTVTRGARNDAGSGQGRDQQHRLRSGPPSFANTRIGLGSPVSFVAHSLSITLLITNVKPLFYFDN